MKKYTKISLALLVLLSWLVSFSGFTETSKHHIKPKQVDLDFDGINSKGELIQVVNSKKAVLLLAGSGPYNMDATFEDKTTGKRSHLLKDIAEHLAQNGITTLRYNKRYVTGFLTGDMTAFFQKSNYQTLTEDAITAFNLLQKETGLAAENIYIYGWSEGTLIGTKLAAEIAKTGKVAGLILQGAVATNTREIFQYQLNNVIAPWMTQQFKDDLVTPQQILEIMPVGNLQSIYLGSMFDPASFATKPAFNQWYDQNSDSQLSIKNEYIPVASSYMANMPSSEGLNQFETLLAQTPSLILQGDNDGNTPKALTDKWLKTFQSKNVSYKHYVGLGHSLGKIENIAEDNFPSIEQQPLNDMVEWILMN